MICLTDRVVRYFISPFLLVTAAAFFFGASVYSQKDVKKDAVAEDLPNFKSIDENFYRGGRPTEAGIKELAKKGVKTVINLRNNKEDAAEEEKWVKSAGLKFYNAPLNIWFRPKEAQIKKILAVIDSKENQPVYIHCNLGADRTGMVTAVYRISHNGWTAKQANAEAKESGLGKWQFWMRDYINDYYRDFVRGKK